MNNTIAEFGFNTDLEHDGYTAWAYMGSKYNFNVGGKVLGVFSLLYLFSALHLQLYILVMPNILPAVVSSFI